MPAPVDFAACALLGTASAALVGRAFVQIQPGYTQPVQLWCAMTGDSGAKKTPTLNKFLDPLRKWLMEERVKADPYFDEPSARVTITTDATPEAHLALTVGMQPSVLEKLSANEELASRGFPQRLLYFLSEPMGHYIIKDLPKLNLQWLDAWNDKVRQ